MRRIEIIDEAKQLVLDKGPANILEFGEEIFDSQTNRDMPQWEHKAEILAEARKQARRVYIFLGYEA
jgi:hypothetical protein